MVRFKLALITAIRNLAYRVALRYAAGIRTQGACSVLILPGGDGGESAGPHSFGDEMLLLGLLDGLKGRFLGNITILQMNGPTDRTVVLNGVPVKVIGFSRNWVSFSSFKEFISIAVSYSHFVVIGADVMDNAYSVLNTVQRVRFLLLAAAMGLKTVVTGCSFNEDVDPHTRELLKTAERAGTFISARDGVSLDRMLKFLTNVRLVADLAFGIDAEEHSLPLRIAAIRDRARRWREQDGVVIGVNLCGWHIKDKDKFFTDFIAALLQWDSSSRRVGLILIPHDTRNDRLSDLDTLTEFQTRLGGRITVIGTPQEVRSGIEAKQAVRCCDVLLTGRMHLAIAALDQGVPPVSFCYQGKFEGLYQMFGLSSEWLMAYDTPDKAVDTLRQVQDKRDEWSDVITGHVTGVRMLAHHNFDWLEGVGLC